MRNLYTIVDASHTQTHTNSHKATRKDDETVSRIRFAFPAARPPTNQNGGNKIKIGKMIIVRRASLLSLLFYCQLCHYANFLLYLRNTRLSYTIGKRRRIFFLYTVCVSVSVSV